ncbi:ferric reductase-like transmembrane domain-containing protein [Candidatus Parcubacteria bacterium]|nr:ferric reductase-like transmembrane domain-containing protein [Candidatus Parcubacteria bacterium]
MKVIQRERGKILFLIIFLFIPLGIWLGGEGQQFLFTNLYTSLTTIGKIAGIIGVGFFAGNMFLSGRYKVLDRLFHGLDRVYLFHRQTGIRAFVLLTIHLLALTFRNLAFSFQAVIDFTTSFSNIPVLIGRVGYYGFLVLIIITLFVRMKYERLKRLHQFMGVFLFFGGLHVYLIPSDVSVNMYLRWYILGIVALALISYSWRVLLRRWIIQRTIADVIAVNKLGDTVIEVVMKPQKEKVNFIPGQFIFVKFKQPGFPYEDHPFSLTASTEEPTLRISAKALGDFTKKLPELKPGAEAHIQGPFGGFSFLKSENKKQIWIAGGIGITPFMSMARSLRDRVEKDPTLKEYDITLFYSVKNEPEHIYAKELEEISQKLPNFHFIPWVTDRDGFINAARVHQKIKVTDETIFICGPKPMLNALRDQFQILGISRSRIHFELFKLL